MKNVHVIPRFTTLLAVLLVLGGSALAHANPTYWNLKLKEDPRAEVGELAFVKGKTAPAGVHFILPESEIDRPKTVTVVATDPGQKLTLKVFKKDPNQPLATIETDAEGVATQSFRSGEKVFFQVTGPEGADYQLAAWVGPEIKTGIESPVVAMSSIMPAGSDPAAPAATAPPVSPEAAASQAPATAANEAPAAPAAEGTTFVIYLLLGGILVLLGVIAGLMFRGQQMRQAPVVVALALFSLAFFGGNAAANSPESNIDLRPSLVKEGEENPKAMGNEMREQIKKLKELSDKVKTLSGNLEGVTGGAIDPNNPYDFSPLRKRLSMDPSQLEVANMLKQAVNLLEHFGYIDPAENFVKEDYNPKGLPALPSRAVDDYKLQMKERIKFSELQDKINNAKHHLEKNYVVLKKTEIHTNRLMEMADGAAALNGIAQMYWANAKANPDDPMNKSKAGFYKKYDGGQQSGIEYLENALKEMAEFEMQNYGDRNWYVYYALPYMNYMRARYIRPGA